MAMMMILIMDDTNITTRTHHNHLRRRRSRISPFHNYQKHRRSVMRQSRCTKYSLLLIFALASSSSYCYGSALVTAARFGNTTVSSYPKDTQAEATSSPSSESTLQSTIISTMQTTFFATDSETMAIISRDDDSNNNLGDVRKDDNDDDEITSEQDPNPNAATGDNVAVVVGHTWAPSNNSLILAPAPVHVQSSNTEKNDTGSNSGNSTGSPEATTKAPSLSGGMKKTFMPTEEPLAPPSISTPPPTFVDTLNRQDAPGPGNDGGGVISTELPTVAVMDSHTLAPSTNFLIPVPTPGKIQPNVPSMAPSLSGVKKTFLPTEDSLVPPFISTSSPTSVESFYRQDTPGPGNNGGSVIFTEEPTTEPLSYKKTAVPTEDFNAENSTPVPTSPETMDRQDTPALDGSVVNTAAPSFLSENVTVNVTTDEDENNSPTNPVPPPTDAPETSPPDPIPGTPVETDPPQLDSPRPTPGLTRNPTDLPTRPPTRKPTRSPTKNPTTSPTPEPTKIPTFLPTPFPTTRRPTPQPVPWPTTVQPSLSPTHFPTGSPTPEPIWIPSGAPSTGNIVTTESPVTVLPSASPTTVYSLMPTISSAPTTETFKPTVSAQPSDLPSVIPSRFPSDSPSNSPTVLLSSTPTGLPSSSPSQAPSLSLQTQGERVVMTMRYCDELEGLSIITWEETTAKHIKEHIVNVSVDPPMDDLRVLTNIVRQTPVMANEADGNLVSSIMAPPPSNRLGRSLQNTESNLPLRIAFDTAVWYRSPGQDHDIQELISNAFDTDEDRSGYINKLKRTNDGAFASLEEIGAISVGGVIVPVEPESGDSQDMTIFIIIGACAGGGALLLLVLFLFWRNYTSKKTGSTISRTEGVLNSYAGNNVTTEIVVEHERDEVSTLGDPMGGMYNPNVMMNTMERDERTASLADDYDYKYLKHHNFNSGGHSRDRMMSEDDATRSRLNSEDQLTRDSSGKSGSQTKLGLSHMGESIFSDDASFEEQYVESDQQVPFEITAPAGKLGMVIDTPNGGFPIVHAIKDTSILADKVRVGDRLVSVDGQDCTAMTAVQVSKLISLKSDQASRILVFVRNRARPNTVN